VTHIKQKKIISSHHALRIQQELSIISSVYDAMKLFFAVLYVLLNDGHFLHFII